MNEIVKDFIDFAEKAKDKFYSEIKEMKIDRDIFSSTKVWDDVDEKVRGKSRDKSIVNPLPMYRNAICNSFNRYPYDVEVVGQAPEIIKDKLKKISIDSGLNDIIMSCESDAVIMGKGFAFITTNGDEIQINYADDPSQVIIDSESKAIDGSDIHKIAFVDKMSYEKIKQTFPSFTLTEDELKASKNLDFGCWESGKYSYNVASYFTLDDSGVTLYKIIGDEVVDTIVYEGLKKIPVVPLYGNEFWKEGRRHYKGIVRDVRDLIKIVNYSYSALKERLACPLIPKTRVSFESIEGYIEDYTQANKSTAGVERYKEWSSDGRKLTAPFSEYPELKSNDLLIVIENAKSQIANIIGVPQSGLAFETNAAQATATEVLLRSQANVNNVSHYYQHAKSSLKNLMSICLELLCYVEGIENTFTIAVTNGPETYIRKEALRQQLMATQSLVPDAVKPLIMAEVVKTLEIENAEALSNAILLTLPEELRPVNKTPEALALELVQSKQQIEQLQQALQQISEQSKQLQETINTDVINSQNQLLMVRVQNESSLKTKLIEMQQRNKEFELNYQLEIAKVDASQREKLMAHANEQAKIQDAVRQTALKEIELAENMRLEEEKKRSELLAFAFNKN